MSSDARRRAKAERKRVAREAKKKEKRRNAAERFATERVSAAERGLERLRESWQLVDEPELEDGALSTEEFAVAFAKTRDAHPALFAVVEGPDEAARQAAMGEVVQRMVRLLDTHAWRVVLRHRLKRIGERVQAEAATRTDAAELPEDDPLRIRAERLAAAQAVVEAQGADLSGFPLAPALVLRAWEVAARQAGVGDAPAGGEGS